MADSNNLLWYERDTLGLAEQELVQRSSFEETQEKWATWGLVIFCVSIVFSAMYTFFIFAAHM